MSCRRWFPRLSGHLITFRQSFLVFTLGYIYNFSIFQWRPADAATPAPLNGTFQVGSQTIPAWCLFFSSGRHQICISSSESSVYLTAHSRASAVHLTLMRFRTKAGAKMSTWEREHSGVEAAPLRMCWFCDTVTPHSCFWQSHFKKHRKNFQILEISTFFSLRCSHTCLNYGCPCTTFPLLVWYQFFQPWISANTDINLISEHNRWWILFLLIMYCGVFQKQHQVILLKQRVIVSNVNIYL